MSGRSRGWLTAQTAVAPSIWGTTYVVTTEFLPPERPLLAGAARALPAGLVLVALCRQLPTGSWWWRSFVLGTLNIGAFFALLFVAAYRLPGGVAATLGAAAPLLVAVLAVPLLREGLPVRRVAAGLGGVVGVSLLVRQAENGLDLVGVAAGLGGMASMAVGVVLTQRWGRPGALLSFTGWQLTAGGLVLAPLALAFEGLPASLTGRHLGGYAYLSLVGAALAYALWFRGIDRLSAPTVAFLPLLSPVVATLLGAAVLSQTLSGWQSLGFFVALASILAGAGSGRAGMRARRSAAGSVGARVMPPRCASCRG